MSYMRTRERAAENWQWYAPKVTQKKGRCLAGAARSSGGETPSQAAFFVFAAGFAAAFDSTSVAVIL